MKGLAAWFLPAVALVAVGFAVWAGPNLSIAVPAVAVATLATSLLFVAAWYQDQDRSRRSAPPPWEPELFRLRYAIRSGPLGREELVTTLDRVERNGPTPTLPPRSPEEMESLVRLSPNEFRQYLRSRLDDLESRV
ncbi:MAG: hypothetical protein ACREDE_01145 [Thermoplasmata archaeon]